MATSKSLASNGIHDHINDYARAHGYIISIAVRLEDFDNLEQGRVHPQVRCTRATAGALREPLHPRTYQPPTSNAFIAIMIDHASLTGCIPLTIKECINLLLGRAINTSTSTNSVATIIRTYCHEMRSLEKYLRIPALTHDRDCAWPTPSARVFQEYLELRAPNPPEGYTLRFMIGLLGQRFHQVLRGRVSGLNEIDRKGLMGFFWLCKAFEAHMAVNYTGDEGWHGEWHPETDEEEEA